MVPSFQQSQMARGEDELAHARRRPGPRGAEALLDVGLDLRAQPEQEPSLRIGLQVVAHDGEVHGAAGERHRDPGAELEPLGVLGGEEQRQEHVVTRLGRPGAVVARGLGRARRVGDGVEIERDASVHFHGRRR